MDIATAKEETAEVTLSSGVSLRLRKYSRIPITDIFLRFPDPSPPILHDDDRGIDIANEEDPEWKAAVQAVTVKRWQLAQDYMIMMGTEVAAVPDGVEGVEGENWVYVAEHTGQEIDSRSLGRYLAWVKFVAIRSTEDQLSLVRALQRLNGTLEEDVAAAAASFRDQTEGGSDNRSRSPVDTRYRDQDRAKTARSRQRVRRKDSGG